MDTFFAIQQVKPHPEAQNGEELQGKDKAWEEGFN